MHFYATSAKSEREVFFYSTALVNWSLKMLLDEHFQLISENFMNSPTANFKF